MNLSDVFNNLSNAGQICLGLRRLLDTTNQAFLHDYYKKNGVNEVYLLRTARCQAIPDAPVSHPEFDSANSGRSNSASVK